MTTAESIANARLDERHRCADRLEEMAAERQSRANAFQCSKSELAAIVLRDAAAELRRL